jgi:hypothetical protein
MDDSLSSDVPPARPAPVRELRQAAEDAFHHTPIVVKYPGRAGEPISMSGGATSEQAYLGSLHDSVASNPYAPFTSKMDWEIARWAKLRGSGSTAFNDLLAIEGVLYFYLYCIHIAECDPSGARFVRSVVWKLGTAQ